MDFSLVKFVFTNVLFSAAIENFNLSKPFFVSLSSNILLENLVMMASINNTQFYWIA